jgi:hypothetical protein
MITTEIIGPLISDIGPMAVVLAYLYLRDRRMEKAILQLAEETDGVDRSSVREQLEINLGDD